MAIGVFGGTYLYKLVWCSHIHTVLNWCNPHIRVKKASSHTTSSAKRGKINVLDIEIKSRMWS